MATKLDAAANVVSVAAGCAVCVIIGLRLLNTQTAGSSVPYRPGDVMDGIRGVRYMEARRTVLIFVRSTCPYCSNSMGFYRQLLRSRMRSEAYRVVFASTEAANVTESYLSRHAISADAVVQTLGSEGGKIFATPTLVIIDGAGRVIQSWVGQLNTLEERAVTTALR